MKGLNKWNTVLWLLVLLGCVFLLIQVIWFRENMFLTAIGFIFMTAGVVLSLWKLRCPFCHKILWHYHGRSSPFCPCCGTEFSEEGD